MNPPSERSRPIPGYPPPRRLPATARVAVDPSETAQVTVVVKSKGSEKAWRKLLAASMTGPPQQRRYLSRRAFGKAWGAAPEALATVRAYGKAKGLKTVSSDAWRRCVVLSGTLAQLEAAFGVQFFGVQNRHGSFRSHHGIPQLPPSVARVVEGILGLDNLPSAEPRMAARRSAGRAGLNVGKLRAAYDFPAQSGKGQCVAIIELGGGFYERDYRTYFRRIGVPRPPLRIVTLPGATNDPAPRSEMKALAAAMANGTPYEMSYDEMWTWEAAMDVEIVGTLAPGAEMLLAFGTFDDQGQYQAITSVLADAQHAPSVISCSWAFPEKRTTPILTQLLDRWFQAAAILGVTMCVSAGDHGDGTLGQTSCPLDFVVNTPASNPYVLACGGTTLDIAAGRETAWKQSFPAAPTMAGGGGFSRDFEPPPAWQAAAGIDSADWIPEGAESGYGRGVPDVSARADVDSDFSVIAGGAYFPASGTSAAAPIWAALVAALNEGLGCALGSINALLYEGGLHESLRDITKGNIGTLPARKGWDPATGWGSPHGQAMLDALGGTQSP